MMRILHSATLLICFATLAPTAQAADCPSCGLSHASEALSNASGQVIEGSFLTVTASGIIVVESVKLVGDSTVVVLKNSVDGSRATLQLSGNIIKNGAIISGAVIETSAVATGHLLISAGKVIAFIPNEIGKALIHHEQVK